MTAFTVTALAGFGEVGPGTDLADSIVALVALRDDDVVVVTSKVVSKAEDRVLRTDRDAAAASETDRVVARRGATTIVRTRHGLVMAAAGVDASNVEPGSVVLLPLDPDRSARALRERLLELTGANVAVLVTDTSGRAWRAGQTDIAIGAAGLEVLHDLAGGRDPYGNPLVVTAPAVADELAAAGDLAKGKVAGTPVAVVRGLAGLVLEPGQHGPGAVALVREEAADLFGYGAREAVLHAHDPVGDGRGFGEPAPASELVPALRSVLGGALRVVPDGTLVRLTHVAADDRARGRVEATTEAVARAHRWTATWDDSGDVGIARPALP